MPVLPGALRRVRRRSGLLAALLVLLALAWTASIVGSGLEAPAEWRRVLLLTAHPDDEVMFFAPVVHALSARAEIFGLCLSEGNADGYGAVRREELKQAYGVLGVGERQVRSIDDPYLQDGMKVQWDALYIAQVVEQHVQSIGGKLDAIITFDGSGVSGHANHVALHAAAPYLGAPVYALRTLPLALKYLGLPSALLRHGASTLAHDGARRFLSSPREYGRTLLAMRAHASQLVWFRYLYVLASAHMWSAVLDRVAAAPQ